MTSSGRVGDLAQLEWAGLWFRGWISSPNSACLPAVNLDQMFTPSLGFLSIGVNEFRGSTCVGNILLSQNERIYIGLQALSSRLQDITLMYRTCHLGYTDEKHKWHQECLQKLKTLYISVHEIDENMIHHFKAYMYTNIYRFPLSLSPHYDQEDSNLHGMTDLKTMGIYYEGKITSYKIIGLSFLLYSFNYNEVLST